MKLPETDAEVIELCRSEMQAIIDRTDWSARGEKLIKSAGLPHLEVKLLAADLTEIGKFEVVLPAEAITGCTKLVAGGLRRHWVYRHTNGQVVSLQIRQRVALRNLGYVRSYGFLNDVLARHGVAAHVDG